MLRQFHFCSASSKSRLFSFFILKCFVCFLTGVLAKGNRKHQWPGSTFPTVNLQLNVLVLFLLSVTQQTSQRFPLFILTELFWGPAHTCVGMKNYTESIDCILQLEKFKKCSMGANQHPPAPPDNKNGCSFSSHLFPMDYCSNLHPLPPKGLWMPFTS